MQVKPISQYYFNQFGALSPEEIIHQCGGKIHLITSEQLNNGFVKIKNSFDIFLLKHFSFDLKKFFLLKALGIYIIDSHKGTIPIIEYRLDNNHLASQFAVEFLLPDELFNSIKHLPNLEISKLFQIPEFVIAIKRTLIH